METRQVDYELMCKQLVSLAEGVTYEITNLANASALIYETLPDLNWAGFYLFLDGALLLGPFQGKTACTKIALGRGVCGTAAAEDETQLVADVHEFPGHIACDGASNSEIVIPLHKDGALYGVLDLDSPSLNRFSTAEQVGFEQFARVLEEILAAGGQGAA